MTIEIINEIVLPNETNTPKEVRALAWSPCGRYLIGGGQDKLIKVWDVEEEELLHCLEGFDAAATSSAWSPNSSRFIFGFYDKDAQVNAIVFDRASGDRVFSLSGHKGYIQDVAWLNNNNFVNTETIWTGSDRDAKLVMWDPSNGAEAFAQEHPDELRKLIPSPDQSKLFVGQWPKSAVIWRLGTHSSFQEPTVLTDVIPFNNGFPWSADSSRFLVKTGNKSHFGVFDADTGDNIWLNELDSKFAQTATWSPDGQKILCEAGDCCTIFDAYSGKELIKVEPSRRFPDDDRQQSGTWDCEWVFGGKAFLHISNEAFMHHEMRIINAQTGEAELSWELFNDGGEAKYNDFNALAVSPCGTKVAIGDSLSNVFVLELEE